MSDIYTKRKRSEIMSLICSKNTKPELFIRKLLFSMGYRYRLHVKNLPGKPDIVLPKYKSVIFINGCFWHGHKKCKKSLLPKTNYLFWENKINNNKKRDRINYTKLKKIGWKYLIIWQCDIQSKKSNILKKIMLSFLNENTESTCK